MIDFLTDVAALVVAFGFSLILVYIGQTLVKSFSDEDR